MGFEPTIQLPVYYLSRVAPSTTRTPLCVSFFCSGAKIGYFLIIESTCLYKNVYIKNNQIRGAENQKYESN